MEIDYEYYEDQFGDYSSPDLTPHNFFIIKMIYNFLGNYSETYRDAYVVQSLLHDPGFLSQTRSFKTLNTKLRTELEKDSTTPIKEIITKTDVIRLREELSKEIPDIEKDFQISEISKTFGELLELTKFEIIILEAAKSFLFSDYIYRRVFDNVEYYFSNINEALSCIFGMNNKDVNHCLNGLLFKSGLLIKDGCHAPANFWGITPDLEEIFVSSQPIDDKRLEEILFPHLIETSLTIDDYPHMENEIKRTISILKKSEKGHNILFWGLAGCGKTELAFAIAKELAYSLKVIGDVSGIDTKEESRSNRLLSLKLATKLYKKTSNVILLFDEMEDLFKDDNRAQFSKAFLNRIIETSEVPIIWTTNSITKLGQPILRRMVYNIGFSIPDEKHRIHIWKKYIKEYKLNIKQELLDKLNKNFPLVPSIIHNAVKVTKEAFGNKRVSQDEIFEIVSSLDTLMNFGTKREIIKEYQSPKEYNISCVNSETNIPDFVDKLVNAKSHGFSCCFYGKPGTGKSELARYIADKMGKKVLFKRASDLQSMWVGQCEKNIAEAFKTARDSNQVLIIDEGDTFLQSREKAERSWEISQVNEMLSQMESHNQPFFITTNLMDNLDVASLRRFTFKIEFNYLLPNQINDLFNSYFGKNAPDDLLRNKLIAPGDFANVKRQCDILGITDVTHIAKLIDEETKIKPGESQTIGFM